MNTALSVSYGPNGYYQGPGQAGRPPLGAGGPGFGLADDAASSSTSPNPDKGHEASAVLAGTLAKDGTRSRPGLTRVEVEAPLRPPTRRTTDTDGEATPQNRLPVAEDIGDTQQDKVKVVVEAPAGLGSSVTINNKEVGAQKDLPPAPVTEEVEEVIGEEPDTEPPAAPALQLSAERRAQLEAVARVRVPPSVEEQRRLFLQHHNKHLATFNQHLTKYNGDVSRVAIFSRS